MWISQKNCWFVTSIFVEAQSCPFVVAASERQSQRQFVANSAQPRRTTGFAEVFVKT